MPSKRFKKLPEKTRDLQAETVDTLIPLLKQNCTTKFDESLDLSLQINNKQKKNEISIRTVINLPGGTSKKVKNLGKLNLFYRFEHEFNGYPYSISGMEDWSSSTHALTGFKNWHIIGLNFNFNI